MSGLVLKPAAAADLDFAAPVVTVTSHANGAIVTTRTIVLSGTATDAGRGGSGISSVYVRGYVDGASTTGNGVVNWSREITLNPGANYLEVDAYDASANKNQGVQQITINFQPTDSIPPNLTVTSHQDGEIVHTKQITLSGAATDAGNGNNGISSVYLSGYLPNTSVAGAGTVNWSKTVELHRGANSIYVYAYDASDVTNEKLISLTINFQPLDPLGPTIAITSHANGQTVGTSSIVLQGTATDAGRGDNGISSVYLTGYLPNTSVAGAGIVNWSKAIDLHPGRNDISVYAYDASDVQNESVQTITINFQPADTLPPLLVVTSHTNGQTVFTDTITVSGTATDAGQGDHGISQVYLQGKIPNANTTGAGVVNWSKSVTLLPGRNYLFISADDVNEFPNQASQTLTINYQPADTLGPNLGITSHFDGQTVNTKTVEVRGTASDAGRGDNGISAVYLLGKIPDSTATGGALVSWKRTIDLNPGRNVISVSAFDATAHPNETDLSIVINFAPSDPFAPSLVVTSHTDGQVVYTNVITVAGTATDAGRGDNGVAYVKVNFTRAEGDTAVGGGVANWSRTFALNPGNNNIYVSAADNSEFQNETNLTLRVVYQLGDISPPTLTIDAPRNNATVSTSTITVSGTATDSGTGNSGIAGITLNGVQIAGAASVGAGTVNWNQAITLQRGANVIALVATDSSPNHNAATATITVNYEPVDLLPPTVTIESHRNNQTVSTPSITLQGTATDNGSGGSGIASVTVNGVQADGNTAAGTATAQWSRVLNLTPGANAISVVARDNSPARNQAAQSITINYDPTDSAGPEITITSHRKDQTVSVATITLAGSATDAGHGENGIASVTVNGEPTIGGTVSGAGTATWSKVLTLNPGANLISVVAKDNSAQQNSTAETMRITYDPVDRTAPEITVTSHKNGHSVGTSSITLAGTATDADYGDNGIVSVTVNGAAAAGGTAAGAGVAHWSAPLKLNLGDNVISIVAADSKQNSAAVTLVLKYDPQLASAGGDFCWVRSGGSAGEDAAYAIALDSAGNSYVAGAFEGSANFGTTNLVSKGDSDIFVAKYDAEGNLLWARQAGGSAADVAFGIAVSTNGNCFVTGYYSKGASFGSVNVTTTGTFDLFVTKYSPDGNVLWVSNTGKGAGILGKGIAVDAKENCYVAGSFAYDAFFGDTQFLNNELYDGFVAKFDPNGKLLWTSQLGGDDDDHVAGLAVDPAGRCYVTGFFSGDAFFGDEMLTSAGDKDLFLCQFTADGKLQWVEQAGELNDTQPAGLAVDASGNCYVTGYYESSATFGTNTLSSDGFFDLFLAKYDAEGKVLWARNTENSNAINGGGVAVDGDGNPYVIGSFVGAAAFGDSVVTNSSSSDVFVAKYDTSGSNLWVRTAGGESALDGFAIAVSPGGVCEIVGQSSGVALFGANKLINNTIADAFVAKLSSGISATIPLLAINAVPVDLVQLGFFAESCATYRLQGSANLSQWSTLLTTNGVDGPVSYPQKTDQKYHFFRVVSP